MEFLNEIGIFALKWLIAVIAIIVVMLAALALSQRGRRSEDLEIEDLNDKFKHFKNQLHAHLLDKKSFKKQMKDLKKEKSAKPDHRSRLFVLDFNGDIKASQVDQLRDEVSAILAVAAAGDQVLINIESPGGTVHGYGLGAAQLLRLKNANLQVIAAVDKVAASGGYLMACTAHKILAAPFAILGSIGVVAQIPNFHRLLKKNEIDYEEVTSGEFKRTVSLFGEITPKGKQKFTEQIEDTHQLFKDFVAKERPQLNVDQVATGEFWFGFRALDLKLVDEIKTSDEFIYEASLANHKVLKVQLKPKQGLADKLQKFMGQVYDKFTLKELSRKRFFETGIQ